MATSSKHRRRLMIGTRPFYWCVVEHEDLCEQELRVISADKRLVVRYLLDTYHPFVRVFGPRLPGEGEASKNERFYACPRFDSGIASPKIVRQVVEWCLSPERPLVPVRWTGFPLPTEAAASP
jgi:hypothetical protein